MRRLKFVLIFAVLIAIVAVILLNLPHIQESKKADIAADFTSVQGTQGLTEEKERGMEKVKVAGEIWNHGNREAKNIEATAIFIDEGNKIIVRKTVEWQSSDVEYHPTKIGIMSVKKSLMPNEHAKISAEYLRKATVPKTAVEVKIKVEWEENGQHAKIFPPVALDKHSERTEFFEKAERSNYSYTHRIIPELKGDYEVIYLFKENESVVGCGDDVFYNVSSQNPIEFSFPVQRKSKVEYWIEIYGLDGILLHSTMGSIS